VDSLTRFGIGDPTDTSIKLRPLEPASGQALARDLVLKTRRRKGLSDSIAVSKYLEDEVGSDVGPSKRFLLISATFYRPSLLSAPVAMPICWVRRRKCSTELLEGSRTRCGLAVLLVAKFHLMRRNPKTKRRRNKEQPLETTHNRDSICVSEMPKSCESTLVKYTTVNHLSFYNLAFTFE
jgi:hypothetical protein